MSAAGLTRRGFLASAAGSAAALWLTTPAARARAQRPAELAWHDVAGWGVEGRGWADTEAFYDRLPARAKASVRPALWELSRHCAGLCARFQTDAPEIHVRYTLRSAQLALPHMPATGVSGFDLYAQDERGRWRWVAATKPTAREASAPLATGLLTGMRSYLLYLPLYNGVERLEVGVPEPARLTPMAPRSTRPIVYYGTSIAQGACASRPGLAFTAILGRRLDWPLVNLGFSGNGKLEPELSGLLAELDAAVYVLDCLPNLEPAQVAERTEPFVRTLRRARGSTPIVLVEDRSWAGATFLPRQRQETHALRAELQAAYRRLRAAGVSGLWYVQGDALLGDDGEATVDGSHPNDLGMRRYADALEPVLRQALRAGR